MSHGESRSTERGDGARAVQAYAGPRLLITRRGPALDSGTMRMQLAPPAPYGPPPTAPRQSAADEVGPADRDEFLERVLGDDDAAASDHVEALRRRGVGVSTIYLELLAPTAERLGRMWEDDACDFVDVTLATGRMQRAVRELGHAFVGASPSADAPGWVLLSAIPGEQHTLGLFMVAEYLLRDGWGVRIVTPTSSAELAAVLREGWFDVVGFSAACDTRLLALRHEIAAMRRQSRNAHVSVLVGGRIFVQHPELVGRVGADGFAASAADASSCARALLGAHCG